MSTNYYFQPSESSEYKDFKHLHIGKSSAGWEFVFRSYDFEGGEIPLNVPSQLGFRIVPVNISLPALIIKSKAAWFDFLKSQPGKISNEYGDELSLDEMIRIIERLAPGKFYAPGKRVLQSHYEYVKKYHPQAWIADFLDSEGFTFTPSEFF